MGVINGQNVSAEVTNPAFIDANADDTDLGKLNLNNISDPVNSGSAVNNIQREFNANSSYTGKPTNVAIGTTPAWSNNQVGSSTDNLFVRSNNLTGTFDGTTGHAHTGADGQGPQLSGAAITSVPYEGILVQGILLTGVTGGSTDVSTELTGKTPSTNTTTLGVVVNAPYNKNILFQGSGANTGDPFDDGSGNVVYGRLTESVGVWTLTYYSLVAGVETPYSFGAAVDVDWYYQELFNPMVSTPVYNPLIATPSDSATATAVSATEVVEGIVFLSNVVAQPVGTTNVKGTSSRVSKQDHAHEGVHSLGIFGNVTQLLGDVQLEQGAGINLSFDAGKIKIDATASVGTTVVEYRQITSLEASTKSLVLTQPPISSSSVILDVVNGTSQIFSVDYTVVSTTLSWGSLGLDGVLLAGDYVRITYWTSSAPQVEYRTLSSGEATAKSLTLSGTPTNPAAVLLDTIGGSSQIFSLDYTVSGNTLSWLGLGLDGVLSSGDNLRIVYWI